MVNPGDGILPIKRWVVNPGPGFSSMKKNVITPGGTAAWFVCFVDVTGVAGFIYLRRIGIDSGGWM